jgi:hypothetical protein
MVYNFTTLWAAKDKNGQIHLANSKPVKPNEKFINNPDANDEIFIPNGGYFFVVYDGEIEGLTFENSPKQIELKLKK